MTETIPDALAGTRLALHMVAEHVLAPARHAATGHIGLEVRDRAFATSPFGCPPTVLSVTGDEIVVDDGTGQRRAPLTTLAAAAAFTGGPLGAPPDIYSPATVCDPAAHLTIDAQTARRLLSWYSLVDAALRAVIVDERADTAPILWPEHLDVAIRIGDINLGGLGGDETVPEPYVYVGPPAEVVTRDAFFEQPFGAVRTWHQTSTKDEIVSFFRDGLTRARAASRRPS